MKYLIGQHITTDFYAPCVFATLLTHAIMARSMREEGYAIIGAGFVTKDAVPYGRSDSLDIDPSPIDAVILHLFMTQGLNGIEIANQLSLAQIA